eukprot:gnl/MRDRNA2_/MRDRNA2_101258_c0_seq1.p1 gnl/MRDRNA2_/MRDRNA2_101258_c0~~gnl/MRDRNA2_/MRDRNA2_101258_c0_seq1.p1  ORF type:complete len:1045 (+),score=202.18 gnl/MRDRNA2_/MRDRNA2_101258_c0_seq1:77-3211(+)
MENVDPQLAALNKQNIDADKSAKRRRVQDRFEKWSRPQVKKVEGAITFMQVDVDYYTDAPHPKFCCAKNNKVPIIRMFGVNEEGNSVMAHIHGFMPYFFVPCPNGFTDKRIFEASLERQLQTASNDKKLQHMVLSVEVHEKSTLFQWQGGTHTLFFRVELAVPQLVSLARTICERGFELIENRGSFMGSTTYETNIPFALRFMVDRKIPGGGWVEIMNEYEVRADLRKKSHCQIEIDTHYNQIMTQDWMKIAPVRVLSFDIECYNQEGKGFPVAQKNPVIQIAAYVKEHGREEHVMKGIWVLDSCADIAGADVFSFEQESDLLLSFRDFWERVDPDLITGYNIGNFDLPYLLERAETLGVRQFSQLSRLRDVPTRIRENTFNGKETKEISIDGRVQFDMMIVIQREHKLRSYSLNAVSAHFLGDQKEDVHYSMIGELHKTSAETRRRLALYCIKDALLPVSLFDRLLCLYNYIEMARVTGTPINYLLNRGQMIKVTSQLLRKAQEHDYLLPTLKVQASDDKFEGATVLEPMCGFYKDPITTLDFASLYPSIMMAHNLCYCTLVPPEKVNSMNPDDLTKTPSGNHFVKTKVRRGLLPMILDELLSARKRAKKAMKEATDPMTKDVLNGRQLALKVSANSVYGYTGATVGQMPCLEISTSVTSFGRQMIDHTKKLVEEKFCIQNGYAHDTVVVYGDTDSVFVKFGTNSVEEAMRLGVEAAQMVSETFIHPIKLEFEKVYFPYLLLNKKRYAGLYWTKPENYDYLDTKGIETVRRDNCALVQQVVDTVLRKILIDKSIPGAIDYIKGIISQLLQNNIDLSMLVISKSLGKGGDASDYKNENVAHVQLAKKMAKRDPSTAPGAGDRVPYVIVTGAKNQKQYERAEDPLYVLQNDLSVDAGHYIEHQLHQPLMRIFENILPDAESILFAGDHTRKVSQVSSASSAMSKFIKKSIRCMGCKAVIKSGCLCQHCAESKGLEVIDEKVQEVRAKEQEYARLWTQCQRCQGSQHEEVICSNRDCDIFYRRAKVRHDLEHAMEALSKLGLQDAW